MGDYDHYHYDHYAVFAVLNIKPLYLNDDLKEVIWEGGTCKHNISSILTMSITDIFLMYIHVLSCLIVKTFID